MALSSLALTVRDGSSAEAYCMTRGSVLSQHAATALAEKSGLTTWANVGAPLKGGGVPEDVETKESREETRRLLRMLLEIYIRSRSRCVGCTLLMLFAEVRMKWCVVGDTGKDCRC